MIPAEAAPADASVPIAARRRGACLSFVLAVSVVLPYAGLTSFTVDHRIAEIWASAGIAFVALSLVWEGRRRELLAVAGFLVAVFAVTALALGHSAGDAAWWALTGTGQAALMVALYRGLRRAPGWAPETAHDLAALLVATVGSGVALGLVGGFPHLPAGQVSVLLGWWVLRTTVSCFVCAVILLTLFHWDRVEVLPATSRLNLVALVVSAGVGVYGTYHDPSQPQSWLMLVPFVWAGLTLTPRGAAGLSLLVVLGAAGITVLPRKHFGYAGVLPASSMVDLLLIACVGAAMLLALMREQRARLIAELDRRGTEAETQRRMLELVFDGMADGVMIADPDGVMAFNPAARQIIGRPIPLDQPVSWCEAFGVRDADDRQLTDEELRSRIAVDDGGRRFLEVRLGGAGDRRIVEVTTRPLVWDLRAATLVLLHDVTAARERVRALRDFAGVVAHDLRGPLTGLEGWLELAADGRQADDPALVDRALQRARDATTRMHQVVGDWLTYTVVRDAELRPEPVRLAEVTAEIAHNHRGDDDAAPDFRLELGHTVRADVALLRQLIDNLVGNAVKYTENGRPPQITIRSRPDDEEGWIRVDVVDDGIGIPEGHEEAIFEEFRRGGVEGRSAGTGLGLALTRRIVLRHGGRMTAARNADRGSTFSFTLPAG